MATYLSWPRKYRRQLEKNLNNQRLEENLAFNKLDEANSEIYKVLGIINNRNNREVRKYLPQKFKKLDFFTVSDEPLNGLVRGYLQEVLKKLNESRKYHAAVKEFGKSVKERIFQLRDGKDEVLLEHEREWITLVEKMDEMVLGIIEAIHETLGILDERPHEIEEEIALHDLVVKRVYDHHHKIVDCYNLCFPIKSLEIQVQMDEDKLKK